VNGITAYDAAKALRHSAEVEPLTGPALIAADVDQSGQVSALDASYMLQMSVGLISSFPGASSPWLFSPASYEYPDLTENLTNQDFTGILLGDPTGNWNNLGMLGHAMQGDATILTIEASEPDVDGRITATIFLDPNGYELYGLDLSLSYDETHVQIESVSKGGLGDSWFMASNTTQPGILRISIADTQPLIDAGSIVEIVFNVLEPQRSSYFLPDSGSINEGLVPLEMTGVELGTTQHRIFIPLIKR